MPTEEMSSEVVEVPSDQNSGNDPNDSLYLYFNYGMQKKTLPTLAIYM